MIELNVITALLDENSIPYFIKEETVARMYGITTGLNEKRLFVRAIDEAAAKELIKQAMPQIDINPDEK